MDTIRKVGIFAAICVVIIVILMFVNVFYPFMFDMPIYGKIFVAVGAAYIFGKAFLYIVNPTEDKQDQELRQLLNSGTM